MGRDFRTRARTALIAAASSVALITATGAAAQATTNAAQTGAAQPTREQLNPAGRVRTAPTRERDLFSQEPSGPCPLRDSPLRFTLKSVVFRGVTALSPEQLRAAYGNLVGQDIPVSAICDIRDHAATLLFNRGVLARVDIPAQHIADGQLQLEVIEAHVVNVRIRGDAGHAEVAVERYLNKLRGMKPFDMRKAQRYLLLASDVPGATVRAAIRPSVTGERGAVDLDITVTAKTVAVTANIQNLEAPTTGRFGGLARVDLNSLTTFGDRTSIVAYHTLTNSEQTVIQLLEEARLGGSGLMARGSFVYGDTRPGGSIAALDLRSTSIVGEAELAYPLVRMRRRDLNLAGGFDDINESTDTAGTPLYRDRLRVIYLRADGDDRLDLLDRAIQLNGSMSVRKGVEALGASPVGSDMLTRPGGRPDGWLMRGSARATTSIFSVFQISNQVQAQYSPDPLIDYEQLALGNLTIGRGYDPGAVLGDSGISDATDLRYRAIQVHRLVSVQPYVFYDVGYIHDNGEAVVKSRTLTSAGLGVFVRLANRLNVDLAYAKPFQAPLPGQPRPTPRLLVNITAAVF